METSVKERLTHIERGFGELKHKVLDFKPRAKGLRQTVDAISDDELFRSAAKLGREWREQANKETSRRSLAELGLRRRNRALSYD